MRIFINLTCFIFSLNFLILFQFLIETDITRPMFDGNGYLSFPISETKSIRHLTSFSLEIKTEATDGMILWIGEVSLSKPTSNT